MYLEVNNMNINKIDYLTTKMEAINLASFEMHLAYEDGKKENSALQIGFKVVVDTFRSRGYDIDLCRPSHYKVVQDLVRLSNYVAEEDATLTWAHSRLRRTPKKPPEKRVCVIPTR